MNKAKILLVTQQYTVTEIATFLAFVMPNISENDLRNSIKFHLHNILKRFSKVIRLYTPFKKANSEENKLIIFFS